MEKEPITEAERLRLVYHMITLPESEGGAGITPKRDNYTFVESIFPLHDRKFNQNVSTLDSTSRFFLTGKRNGLRAGRQNGQ